MAEALNYSTKAIEAFSAMDATAAPLSRIGLRYLAEKLRQAQVFILPDHGSLLDRSRPRPEVAGQTFQPAFPVMALEYRAPPGKGRETPGYTDALSSRRIALAWRWADDVPLELAKCGNPINSDGFVVASICYFDATRMWVPMAIAAHVAFDEPLVAAPITGFVEAAIAAGQMTKSAAARARPFTPIAILPEAIFGMVGVAGSAEAMDKLSTDVMDELSAYIDLCYALSCRNVGTERNPAPEKLNKARLKRGQMPFKDFHVLKLADAAPGGVGGTGSGASSRRAHLRRGHIRRLRHLGEGRMTWVNATMVNGRGFVEKAYQL